MVFGVVGLGHLQRSFLIGAQLCRDDPLAGASVEKLAAETAFRGPCQGPWVAPTSAASSSGILIEFVLGMERHSGGWFAPILEASLKWIS